MATDTVLQEVNETFRRLATEDSEIGDMLRQAFPRAARWRYWSRHGYNWHFGKRGRRMFAWSTERLPTGKFASWAWVCTAVNHMEKRQVVMHATRTGARARAERMMDAYQCPCGNKRCGKPD